MARSNRIARCIVVPGSNPLTPNVWFSREGAEA
jgi:hypothetical protein